MDLIKVTKSQSPTILTLTAERSSNSLKSAILIQTSMSLFYKILFPFALYMHVANTYLNDSTSVADTQQNPSVLLLAICTTAFICQHLIKQKITKEQVIVIQNLGVQLYSYNMQGQVCSSRFIDIARVRDVVINESMSYFKLD